MATYHLEVHIMDVDYTGGPDNIIIYDDVMKGKNMPIEAAKELSAMMAQGGFLKEHKGVLETGDASSFTFYPAHRILKIRIIPEVIITL